VSLEYLDEYAVRHPTDYYQYHRRVYEREWAEWQLPKCAQGDRCDLQSNEHVQHQSVHCRSIQEIVYEFGHFEYFGQLKI
jgi:hypothetical protein